MATQPTHPTPPPAPPAHQTQTQSSPAPATPASTEEKKPEEQVVDKDHVKSLFLAGHRLKKKGAKPDEWIAATRLHDRVCLAQPLTDELEKKVLGEELVLVAE